MNVAIITHKEIWLDKKSISGFSTNGGFPFQIKAVSELFESTRLIALKRNTKIKGELTRISGKNISVIALPEPIGKGIIRKIYLLYWLPWHIHTIWKEITNADVIHAAIPGDLGLIGMLVALLKRKKIFIRHCGTWGNRNTLADRFIDWFLPLIAGGNTLVLATGGGDTIPCLQNSNIKWIFSTTLGEKNWENTIQSDLLNAKKDLKLVSVGRLSKDKNTKALIEALKFIRKKVLKVHLDIVGDGPEMEALIRLAHSYDITEQITFHGNLSHSKVMKVLSGASLFLFPTNTKEGFPKVLVEAMACGLPIIASRVSVIPYLVENQCGIILEDTSPLSICDAIHKIISQPNQMEKMGKMSRAISKKYTLENWKSQIRTQLKYSMGVS